jgi:hypothetical protein
MLTIGLAMLAAFVAMLAIARPRNGQPVGWLQTESRQQAYGFTLVLLLTFGGLCTATGFGHLNQP